jgi:hypothetical protein
MSSTRYILRAKNDSIEILDQSNGVAVVTIDSNGYRINSATNLTVLFDCVITHALAQSYDYNSFATTSGAITTAGGVGIGKDVHVGGKVSTNDYFWFLQTQTGCLDCTASIYTDEPGMLASRPSFPFGKDFHTVLQMDNTGNNYVYMSGSLPPNWKAGTNITPWFSICKATDGAGDVALSISTMVFCNGDASGTWVEATHAEAVPFTSSTKEIVKAFQCTQVSGLTTKAFPCYLFTKIVRTAGTYTGLISVLGGGYYYSTMKVAV